MNPSIVALIPARSGSKRIPHKNIRDLGGKPLLAWTIEAARGSGLFEDVFVSTDSDWYSDIAHEYGAMNTTDSHFSDESKRLIEAAVSACRERKGAQLEIGDFIRGIHFLLGKAENTELKWLEAELEELERLSA